MEEISDQSGGSSSKKPSTAPSNNSIMSKTTPHKNVFTNFILQKLEADGFITPNNKAEELEKNLTKPEYLYALRLLIEDLTNKFSSTVLTNLLKALADHTPFDHHSMEIVIRLELHLRTLVAVLERICFSSIVLSKELRDKVYNSLTKFAEFHRKTTQVISEGLENVFRSNQFNQSQENDKVIFQKRNYNIDFLLIHLRDTLHSLRDDETWFREMLRRVKECLKAALNIPSSVTGIPKAIPSLITHLRQGLSFKYPIASYYVGWRIMLIIRYNLFALSEDSVINKKIEEMTLMEYFWGNLEIEWANVVDKSILNSQSKFDEISNELVEVLMNAGSFLNDLVGNEPLALPHTLWFGILDLAQSYIQKSTRKSTYGLCYYLAIESLNKAPSSFIQFKAIEILLHLYNINNELFSMIKIDFDQYTQKLRETKSTDSSEKFQILLEFVREKCFEDFAQLNIDFKLPINDNEKGKRKGKGKCLQREQTPILKEIADEMADPISLEPTDQLCILKCQHEISLNDLKRLKECPICREEIKNVDVKYLPQTTIYNNLHQKFVEANLQSEDSDQVINNQNDSDDSDNSEADQMLTKKKIFFNAIKLNSRVSLSSLFPRFSKKQHPTYQNIIKEIGEKNYEKAESLCKDFLNFFPKSYSLRCVLAYIYRCLGNYEQAHFYLDEAIKLNGKNSIAWYIHGEMYFRENMYGRVIDYLRYRESNINKQYIILGNSYLFESENNYKESENYRNKAIENFGVALRNYPNNYLCLKNCAYVYEKQENYLNTLEMLDRLLSINKKDSLILCYYGEILNKLRRYNESIKYFTKANEIDPENIHILIKKAITYCILKKYDEALLDLNRVIQLNSFNSKAYYYKGIVYYVTEDINNAIVAFKKCTELDSNNSLAKMHFYHLKNITDKNNFIDINNNIITEINEINDDKSLLFIRCKINIELRRYVDAKLELNRLFELDNENFSFVYLLRKYSDFWLYLCEVCKINDDKLIKFGIVDKFNIYMFEDFTLPKFYDILLLKIHYGIIWKINVKEIISDDCYVKFTFKQEEKEENSNEDNSLEYILKYEDLLKLKGLGWIEYTSFYYLYINNPGWIQLSIETNSIDMEIDYVRFMQFHDYNSERICYPEIDHLLSYHQTIPEALKDKYFLREEMENLLELKDIIN
ncbi:Sti1p [Rhizophagus irregularis DAOM 197198w]|uniref:Sti1p n=1 Tax=Rhizophagus irregularis (strain DAOM 197198w) TaxID=1432141 RepID=A0A015JSZ0_RHIIW|nr:Sti1p [Rhizophagus irregularis DAOM 197198w]